MLDHPNQRFRFSYILGRTRSFTSADDDFDDDDTPDVTAVEDAPEAVDLAATGAVVSAAVASIKALVLEHSSEVRDSLSQDEAGDERLIEELI